MRIRYGWLIAIAMIGFIFAAGCSSDENNESVFRGSNSWLNHLYIGNSEVIAGKTVNVPLAQTNRIRFEVGREVTPQSLSQLFDFQIRFENVDTGETFLFTNANLDENGELTWIGDSNRVVEYRLKHNMDYIASGGERYVLGSVGNMFRVKVDFLVGQNQDGTQFHFVGDEFRVVWTESSQGL
ncbi:MAG: hypothetical protein ABIC40_03485 [bacterium]